MQYSNYYQQLQPLSPITRKSSTTNHHHTTGSRSIPHNTAPFNMRITERCHPTTRSMTQTSAIAYNYKPATHRATTVMNSVWKRKPHWQSRGVAFSLHQNWRKLPRCAASRRHQLAPRILALFWRHTRALQSRQFCWTAAAYASLEDTAICCKERLDAARRYSVSLERE